ncbi:hypothetical protein H4217_005066 [Coemansia sp. RSA 1939]|nr:hypothetical protein H4217_005066 [Coemansia sp. RSA 1939]KAJ2607576.1 hypothetical protein EV177_005446 [Coemansia sp. RSA 1804]KAJ2686074.1 hypothetical protein GGH99_003579 [Coemansia sp. RSA 1285]
MSFRFDPENEAQTSSVLPKLSPITGLQDIVREGPSQKVNNTFTKNHEIESRVNNWENQQLGTKLHMQRQIYGLHAPLRTIMEIQSVQKTPALLGSRASRIQLDILMGKDDSIDADDLFGGDSFEADTQDIHSMLAKKLNV